MFTFKANLAQIFYTFVVYVLVFVKMSTFYLDVLESLRGKNRDDQNLQLVTLVGGLQQKQVDKTELSDFEEQ